VYNRLLKQNPKTHKYSLRLREEEKRRITMKKVLLLTILAAIFMSGCVYTQSSMRRSTFPEVDCTQKYPTNEKARLACEKGQTDLRKEIQTEVEKQAYETGRNGGEVSTYDYPSSTSVMIDPAVWALPYYYYTGLGYHGRWLPYQRYHRH
jgi:hypothetical protein